MAVWDMSVLLFAFAEATAISVGLTVYGWRRRGNPGAAAFALFMTAVAVWSAAQTVGLVSPTLELRLLAERIKWIGIAPIGLLFLVFASRYAGHDRWMTTERVGALAAVSALFAAAVWVNPGNAVWANPTFDTAGGLTTFSYDRGPLFWVATTYVYMLGVPATAMLAGLALDGDDLYLGQTVSLVFGATVPLVVGGLSALGATPMDIDLTPVGWAVTGLVFAYGLVRHEFLTVVPATRRIGRDAVVRNVRDGVVVLNDEDRVVDVNPVSERAFDTDRSGLLGRQADSLPGVERDTESDWTGEVTAPDGRVFEVDAAPLTREGRRLGTVLTLRDVTELRTRQQRLTVLNRVLRHNLRNDMNTIDGYATMLADRFDAPPAEQLQEVSAEVIDLADKARDVERVMARRGETDPAPVGDVVESVVAGTLDARRDTDVVVSLDCRTDATVLGRGLLEPALDNVVENAVEHNDADDPQVRVEVAAVDGAAEVVVADNGPGIPPQEREVLLEGTETPLTHGSGLGLWLVYWAVESLDGEVRFEDNDPRGSVVTVRVPTADRTPQADAASAEATVNTADADD